MKAYLIIIIIAITGLIGCKKFLDVQPKDLKIAKTVKDYQDLLNGEGWSKTMSSAGFAELYWLDLLTDDVEEAIGTSVPPFDDKKQYSSFYIWRNNYDLTYLDNANSNYNLETWTWLYRVVNISNMVLDKIDNAEGNSENDRQLLKAEALFSRALANYYILNIWGEPYNPATATSAKGVPLKKTPFPELTGTARSSVQEGYDLILSDLNNAETIITTPGIKPTSDVFHVSKEGIEILLSRIHLYTQNWQKTKEFADKAIATRPTLYDITIDTFTTTQLTNFFNPRNNEVVFSYHRNDKVPLGTTFLFGLSANRCIYNVSNNVISLYTAKDKRKNGFISTNTVPVRYFAKTILQEGSTLITPTTRLFDYNIRVAEAYLNRAEALAQLGDLAGATNDLNTLRAKRISGATNVSFTDKATLLSFIYEERRRELFFQGHRWFDLRRTGMPSITHYYTPVNGTGTSATLGATLKFVLNQNDPGYTIEVPIKETTLNPSLVSLGLPERQPQ